MSPSFDSIKELLLGHSLGVDTREGFLEETFNPFGILVANCCVPSVDEIEFNTYLVPDTFWDAIGVEWIEGADAGVKCPGRLRSSERS